MKKSVICSTFAILAIALASCQNRGDSKVKKDLYGLNTNGEVAKLGDCELLFKQNSDVPYISLDEGVDFMTGIRQASLKDKKYCFTFAKDNKNYTITNEKGGKCTINPEKQTLTFNDYDKFSSFHYENQNPLSIIKVNDTIKFVQTVSSDYTPGKEIVMDLNTYDMLDIYEANNKVYLPLSVYNSALFNISENTNIAYNGVNLFLITANSLSTQIMFIPSQTELGKKFHEGCAKTTVTEAYAKYYYQSLCFDFNNAYGLRNKFNTFEEYLESKGYKNQLLTGDIKEMDNYTGVALTHLEDGHTALTEYSCFYAFGEGEVDQEKKNEKMTKWYTNNEAFNESKEKANIKEGIEYKGDTAFVTFNEFSEVDQDVLYMDNENEGMPDLGIDLSEIQAQLENSNTAKLFNKLYRDLTSDTYKNTIKNIVVDLTSNDGGAADSLIYSLSTLIGNVSIDMTNPISGGHNHQVFKCDLTLDGKIDEKDVSLSDLGFKIFFLNSSYSFSSANAMPVIAKINKPSVHTLGAKTAGGPCAVKYLVTPLGNAISNSSLLTISKQVNGNYVSIDDGIEADHALTEAQMIDRNYIVANINSWA